MDFDKRTRSPFDKLRACGRGRRQTTGLQDYGTTRQRDYERAGSGGSVEPEVRGQRSEDGGRGKQQTPNVSPSRRLYEAGGQRPMSNVQWQNGKKAWRAEGGDGTTRLRDH